MLVDACAIIAIVANEPEARAYRDSLAQATEPFTTSLAALEAVLVLARPEQLGCTFQQAQRVVLRWLDENGVVLRETGDPRTVLGYAVAIADQLGVGKRALSNFDCFHYAHAKAAGAPLLTLDRLLRETDVETVP